MKRINEVDLENSTVKGLRGFVDIMDIVSEPFVAGVRVVHPDSEVPQRVHVHPEKQIIYVIEGTPLITDRTKTINLRPGDFVTIAPNHEHYIITEHAPTKIFEIKYRE